MLLDVVGFGQIIVGHVGGESVVCRDEMFVELAGLQLQLREDVADFLDRAVLPLPLARRERVVRRDDLPAGNQMLDRGEVVLLELFAEHEQQARDQNRRGVWTSGLADQAERLAVVRLK